MFLEGRYNFKDIIYNRSVLFSRFFRIKKYKLSLKKEIISLRSKEVIKVVFILHDASMWKTEKLYLEMLSHSRFEPSIFITLSADETPSSIVKKYNQLVNYLDSKNYNHKDLQTIDQLKADIVFYEKPYDFSYFPDVQSRKCTSLLAYAPYAFNTLNTPQSYDLECILKSFQLYVENHIVESDLKKLMGNKLNNIKVTGLPMMDMLLEPIENFSDPWKIQEKKKKRIIWAPHFTIKAGESWLNLSSFMVMHDFMLLMAEKYNNSVQFAFKPHPLLYNTLIKEWGEQRTKKYYDKWASIPNCQLVTGEYIGLFKHSDALIHDCGSFLIEYLYTGKPVMYTVRDKENTIKLYNQFTKKAFEQLYHGENNSDVERFIIDIINEEDIKLAQRKEFKEKYLLPPNNKTACQNIIDAILGQNGYD